MTIILFIPAYAAIPAALRQIAELRDQNPGANISVLTTLVNISTFLAPLEQLGITIQFIPDEVSFRSTRPWSWWSERARLRKRLQSLFPASKDVCCYFYGSSFSPTLIAAVALAAERGQSIFLEDWDHTSPFGIREQEATSFLAGLLKTSGRFILRAPVHVMRPRAPFLALPSKYLERVASIIPPVKPKAAQSGLHRQILDHVSSTSRARVLWIYDMYEEHYGPDLIDSAAFQDFWRQLTVIVSSLADPTSQAYKVHPRSLQNPVVFCCYEQINPAVPVEFLKTPELRLVIGLSSHALKHFAAQDNISVVSPLGLLPGPDFVKASELITLNQWVDPERRVLRPVKMEDFASNCRSALGS